MQDLVTPSARGATAKHANAKNAVAPTAIATIAGVAPLLDVRP